MSGEQLILGNNAQVLISPRLFINERQASLSLLKNCRVTLTTKNYIDSIPVTKVFEDLKFVDGEELPLDFQVPPNLSRIEVSLVASVTNTTGKDVQQLSASYNVNHTKLETADVFLRQVAGAGVDLAQLRQRGDQRRIPQHRPFAQTSKQAVLHL